MSLKTGWSDDLLWDATQGYRGHAVTIEVNEIEATRIDTGLLDRYGRKLWRIRTRNSIGFCSR